MGRALADTFESLRGDVLDRLVGIRASIDEAYARIPDDVVREQFDVVLGKIAGYLRNEDVEQYRSFVSRWAAMREGEGFGAENVIHSIVAVADVVARSAQRRLEPSPERTALIRAVMQVNAGAARMLVDGLANRLAHLSAQMKSGAAE
jgi:hypothetical protein